MHEWQSLRPHLDINSALAGGPPARVYPVLVGQLFSDMAKLAVVLQLSTLKGVVEAVEGSWYRSVKELNNADNLGHEFGDLYITMSALAGRLGISLDEHKNLQKRGLLTQIDVVQWVETTYPNNPTAIRLKYVFSEAAELASTIDGSLREEVIKSITSAFEEGNSSLIDVETAFASLHESAWTLATYFHNDLDLSRHVKLQLNMQRSADEIRERAAERPELFL